MDRFEYHVNNLIPMPEHRCPDDDKWIRENLSNLSERDINMASEGYAAVFKEAYDSEPISYKKMNAGRRVANEWLSKYINKFKSVKQGKVSKPQIYKAA